MHAKSMATNGAKKYFNTGGGHQLQPIDIGHESYLGLISPDMAFWALIKKREFGSVMSNSALLKKYSKKEKSFKREMNDLRFSLKPSAVYFNPTDKCNLDCSYCYIPKKIRKDGQDMSSRKLLKALALLKDYFESTLPKGQKPQIVFHGAEPMLNKEAVFEAIDRFRNNFRFGIQTNGTLMTDEDLEFLTSRNISIGLSLDGHIERVADRLRKTWSGQGVSKKVVEMISKLKGYGNYSVIATITKENMSSQEKIIEFLHNMEVPICMLNPIRCTLEDSRKHKPKDLDIAKYYLKALDKSYELYKETGRKIIVANFANVLISILAPMARRLMCDISPCGGGRCFFAIAANGDIFPCSEFIGIQRFKGGNLFKNDIREILKAKPFKEVSERRIEDIESCSSCAIRHFCGSPCPAEAWGINGSIQTRGAFCELYEEQVRYAFRLIAGNKESAYLWDKWDKDTIATFNVSEL